MSVQLYYEEKGSGEPLILLHGNGEDHTYFAHQIGFFSRYFRVIAIDTRGHGASPRGEAPFTIRQFADDLHDFMDEHQIGRAHILGFSDGGNIALVFALKYPGHVNKLILNGANLNAKGVKLSVQIPIEIGYRLALLASKRDEAANKKAELLGLMVNDPNVAPEELTELSVRTLVIAGTRDMIKRSHTRLIHEKLPDSTLVFIKGDHFIADKQWKKFNAAVLKFLKGKGRITDEGKME